MKPISSPTAPKPKHRLLAQSRQWHKWGGLVAGAFLLVTGATGIVLNYKQPLFSAFGLDNPPPKPEPAKSGSELRTPVLSTGTGLAELPVSLEQVLAIARGEWGDVPLERIELKAERGQMIYKLKRAGGHELWVNAADGSHFFKDQYERIGKAGADGVPGRTTDWGKILIDLHTGKIGGEVGKAIMTLAAALLLLLTLSGVYVWVKPLLIRRQNARANTHGRANATLTMAETTPTPARERKLVEV
jgi:uncharacterized iron-regulated membrane protein